MMCFDSDVKEQKICDLVDTSMVHLLVSLAFNLFAGYELDYRSYPSFE